MLEYIFCVSKLNHGLRGVQPDGWLDKQLRGDLLVHFNETLDRVDEIGDIQGRVLLYNSTCLYSKRSATILQTRSYDLR